MTATVDVARPGNRVAERQPTRDLVSTGKTWLALAAALAVAGTAGGVALGSSRPVHYTSEVRLSVGSGTVQSLSVPGYVEATQELASTYARYVTASGSQLSVLGNALGFDASEVDALESTPIADSNIIRIRVQSDNPSTATAAAGAIASTLSSVVEAPSEDRHRARRAMIRATDKVTVQSQVVSDRQADLAGAIKSWNVAHPDLAFVGTPAAGPEVYQAKQALVAARSELALEQVDLESATSTYRTLSAADPSRYAIQTVMPAAVVEDSRTRSTQWGGLGGLAVGGALGALVLAIAVRRRNRVTR